MAGVAAGMASLEENVSSLESAQARQNCTWIHLGVHGGSDQMRFEARGFNEADFRCPDECGKTPKQEPIFPEDGPISVTKFSPIDLDNLCAAVQQEVPECKAGVTKDAGRFVCNYCLYTSLHMGHRAVFIHIPNFSVIDEETQYKFLKATVDKISDFAIENIAPPSPLVTEIQDMGFSDELIKTAYLAVNQGPEESSTSQLVTWLINHENTQVVCNTYDDLVRIRGAGNEEEHKVVVVADSSLGMSAGKLAAQVGHAVLAMSRSLTHSQPQLLSTWEDCGEPLIVCKTKSAGELSTLEAVAKSVGVPFISIRDAGRTQVAAGSLTVAAIGPGPISQIDAITGALELM
mmetsp:Transcript_14653/g.27174  ORF Transcript_14653/g.27174 Transcript_14653/m.27174 type:complete len:347 (-) Transcript_14653:119-1159(-)